MKEPLVQSEKCFLNVAKGMHIHAKSPSLKLGTLLKRVTSTKVAAKVECANVVGDTNTVRRHIGGCL